MKANNKLFTTALTLAALTAGVWAQTGTATKPAAKKKHAAAVPAEPAVTAADVQSLKDAIAAQQQQIQQLTQQLQQNQQAWQQSQQQVQQAQSAAADAQQKAVAVQATADQQQNTVTKLSSDVADVKTTVTNTVVASQDRRSARHLESAFGRFRFSGDMRVRGEDYFQQGVPDRNRARVRARFGVDGQLGEDFVGGIYVASGTLGDPTTTNETLTGFFDRKTIGLDRAYITYNPVAAKWLSLTGGKFAFPWTRSSLTFDPDINPEGFDAKVSFDTHHGPLRNFTAQTMLLPFNEVTKGPDSFAAGGSVSGTLEFGPWTMRPATRC